MRGCDVLIVGGGPAGSSCAWRLTRAGLDVVVLDLAVFPRDKVCAGWITPQAVSALALDVDDYRRRCTFQAISAFRTGLIGVDAAAETGYGRAVSYGIRRCEFDHYLLERSGAEVFAGERAIRLRRDPARGRWIVNERFEAPMLVGAGGHFCPVARAIADGDGTEALVVAQEAEFPVGDRDGWTTDAEKPELYFSRDLKGYGWIFRKGGYVNIGLGRLDRRSLPAATAGFVAFLRAHRRIPADGELRWRGHAYLLSTGRRPAIADGAVLVGDAAGLAYAASGEGIRPAIESGLLAASAIVNANEHYARARLEPYQSQLDTRFGPRRESGDNQSEWRSAAASSLAPWLFRVPWFVRHQVLNRWFLRADEPALGT